MNYADSYSFNPHKWMLTNFDCSCLFIKSREVLTSALEILPEYLKTDSSKKDKVTDYRDWQIPLGRRFRALKLWSVIRYYGTSGLQNYIRNHIELAQYFFRCVKNDNRFEIMAPAPLNLVCFRAKGDDELNQVLLKYLNDSGKILMTHTKLKNSFTLRFCVGQTHTNMSHIKQAWDLITDGLDNVIK